MVFTIKGQLYQKKNYPKYYLIHKRNHEEPFEQEVNNQEEELSNCKDSKEENYHSKETNNEEHNHTEMNHPVNSTVVVVPTETKIENLPSHNSNSPGGGKKGRISIMSKIIEKINENDDNKDEEPINMDQEKPRKTIRKLETLDEENNFEEDEEFDDEMLEEEEEDDDDRYNELGFSEKASEATLKKKSSNNLVTGWENREGSKKVRRKSSIKQPKIENLEMDKNSKESSVQTNLHGVSQKLEGEVDGVGGAPKGRKSRILKNKAQETEQFSQDTSGGYNQDSTTTGTVTNNNNVSTITFNSLGDGD